ncbi:hypothetical protein CIG75_11260 [Tumebacillus algifaecis]|uniref:Uncharacterized protein n=1 Tax=Tumebacillus algifaecis TaxID=1214604 RepID=A0A223D1R8_9BACL|nr:hypothetical protein [Tumebacillus algifaecis]ASS75501.1 hypothetical protein CIG75_11260 [Tumebacillus algifaecis]
MTEGKRLLVLHLIDSFNAGIPLGKCAVQADGLLRPPLQKTNGMYVFQNLETGTYTAHVQAEFYFSETVTVSLEELDPLYPVVIVPLTPKPSYPFAAETTLIRAALRDERGIAMAGVRVRGVAVSESSTKAKLLEEATGGSHELFLSRLSGRVRVGERYSLGEQTLSIADVKEASRTYLLTTPLVGNHARGASLLPCVDTWTDARGEVALAFGNCKSASFDVRLSIWVAEREFCKEVRVEESKLLNLRAVNLDDFAS